MSTFPAIRRLLTQSDEYPRSDGTVGFLRSGEELVELISECSKGAILASVIPHHYDPSGDGTTFLIRFSVTFSRAEMAETELTSQEVRHGDT